MSEFTERRGLLSVVISIIFVSMIVLACGGGGGGDGNQVPAKQATFDDFIGKWVGPVEVHTDSLEKINATVTLTVNENGTGTFILDDGNLVETHVISSFIVVNQFLDFSILNNAPNNPDCKNWDFSLTLSLDGTIQGDGTVCGPTSAGLFITISGTLTHEPYYSVRGFVSLPEGAGLKLKDLKLSSPDSDDISIDSATGEFQLNGFGDLAEILFVTDGNDNLILIGINHSTNVVKPKSRMVSEGTVISIDPLTTAISLVCMDPMLALNNDKEFILELEDEIAGLSEIKVLEEYIKSKIISDPTAVIVENDPVLEDLILKARSASINKLISNYVLTATSSYSNRMLGGGPAINATTDGAYNSGINISVNDFSGKSATFEIKNYFLRYLALYKKKNSLLENNDVGDFVKLIKPCPSVKNLKTWGQWLTGNYAHSSKNITLDFSDTTTYGLTFVGPGGKNKILTSADWDIYKPAYWRSATYLIIAPTINIIIKGKTDSFFDVLEGFEELLKEIDEVLSAIEFVDEWILLYDESPLVKMEFIAKHIWNLLTKNDCEYLIRIERKIRGKSFSGARSSWENNFVNVMKAISLIDSGWKLAGSTMSMAKSSQVGLWAATFAGQDDPNDPVISISVTSPIVGAQWQRGTTQTIRWTSSGSLGNVQLQLRDGSGNYSVIANSVANTGSYNWAIPASIAIGSGYQIKVSDVNQWDSVYDHSDSFSLTSGSTDPGFATEGLVGYYPFNGNSNDLSGNGNHGTVHNAILTEDRYGTPNSAYNFTGSSYIEISNTEPFKLTDEITISAWVRSTQNTGSINQRIISFAPSGGQNGFDLFLWSAMGSKFNFSYGLKYATAPTSINYNTWYFVTGVGGPNGVKLYVNGELVAENQNPPSGFNYSGPLYIGRLPNASDYWRGQIDEIRVYNRALSQNEVIALFENNLDPVVSISVTSPNAGAQWQRGTTQTIRWTSSGAVGNVQLQLRDGSGNYSIIANSVANTGSYNWAIPANGVIGSGFQIRVSDVNKWGTIYDHSDSFSLTSGSTDTTPQPIIVLSNISPQDDNTYLGCPYVDDNIHSVQVTVTVKYNIPEDAPLEKYFLLIRNTFVKSSHFFVQPKDYTPIEVSPGDSGETTITFTVRYYDVYSDCYYYGRNGKFLIYIYFSDRKGPFTIYDSGLEHNAFSEHGVIEYKSRGY